MNARRPAVASDAWMLEQQVRAEMEAEAWRRLRQELAVPEPPAPAEAANEPDYHRSGSTVLKALVRFALGAFGGYLAWIAAMDSRLGEFEVWLAVGASFIVTLALSLLSPLRGFVHALAETLRWGLVAAFGLGAVWLAMNPPA